MEREYLRDYLQALVDRIRAYDAQCEEAEYTEVDDLWTLVRTAQGAIETLLESGVL